MTAPERPVEPRRRIRKKPWPWPGDSREDKAKRVAKSYRQLLLRIVQGDCDDPATALERMDDHWTDLDQHWHRPRPDLLADLEGDEWWLAPDLAHAIDRDRKDIYNWARAGHIRQRAGADGAPEYLVSDVVAYNNHLRARRARTAENRSAR